MFSLIPAPGRQFKTVSMWLLIFVGVADLAISALATLGAMPLIHAQEIMIGHTILIFITGVARFVQQQIALTTTQKVDMLNSLAAAPVKEGHEDVVTTITAASAGLPPVPPPSVQVSSSVDVVQPAMSDLPPIITNADVPTASEVLSAVTPVDVPPRTEL